MEMPLLRSPLALRRATRRCTSAGRSNSHRRQILRVAQRGPLRHCRHRGRDGRTGWDVDSLDGWGPKWDVGCKGCTGCPVGHGWGFGQPLGIWSKPQTCVQKRHVHLCSLQYRNQQVMRMKRTSLNINKRNVGVSLNCMRSEKQLIIMHRSFMSPKEHLIILESATIAAMSKFSGWMSGIEHSSTINQHLSCNESSNEEYHNT